MTQPVVGGASKSKFSTGLEDFDWGSFDPGQSSGGSRSSEMEKSAMPMAQGDEGSESSGGGMDMASMIQRKQIMLQMQKAKEDFGRLTKQAKFFLPRTLEGISGQYGTQGSYWSSGRRDAQQEARVKTRFDLKQAKADAEFNIKNLKLQLAAQAASEQQARNA